MERRLVKVASELNVGVHTIVEFLQGKGFDIEDRPTAKVSDDMYNELLKEFQKSIAIKEQADQLVIGTRPTAAPKKELPPLKPLAPLTKLSGTGSTLTGTKPAPEPTPTPAKVEEEPVANAPIAEPTPAPVAPTTAPEQVEPEVASRPAVHQLKVLGKIDLSARTSSGRPVNKPAPAEKAPEKAPEKEQAPAPKAEEAPKPAEPVATPVPPVVEETKAPAVETTPPVKSADVSSDEPEMLRAKTPELRGLKILGKIDTSRLESSRSSKPASKQGGANKPAGQPASSNNAGTTSAGGGTAASDAERKKRKRKRKKVEGGQQTTAGGNQQQSRGPQGGGGGQAAGNRQQQPSQQQNRPREEPQREVSQKEIEEQIKATMARLSGGGKKKRQKLRRDNRERLREKQEMRDMEGQTDKLQVTEFISVQELANLMDVPAVDVIMACMNLGVIVSINQRLDAEVIELVAQEFEHEVEFISADADLVEDDEEEDDPEDLQPRAPIVTIMGHVDHGKTSLLDYVRSANVASGEAGGITQHIGAYEVFIDGDENKAITFLDTPGHEAFTAMRARGAKVTDIAVIVVAADDSIMPQTKEAISHAEAAGVPIIFAINKIDKAGANPEKIKQELASMNYLVEDWGGKYGSADISAKQGTNMDVLLERILLQAEIMELKANPDRLAQGTILEASLDKGRGYVAKMLVQTGSLKVGDFIVSGEFSGRVKAMFNERNKRIKEAGPSTPVLVLGLGGAPQAGERIRVIENESEARDMANRKAQILREQATRATKRISLDEIGRRLALGNFRELNLIVKGDFDGSVEALSDSLIKLSQETVQVNVIHRAVGQIIESDVLLATASDAIVVGFQVRPSAGARKLAEREGVQIKTYSIIYEAIDEIKLAIEGMLDTIKEENIIGQLDVREVFKITKVGTVAGCLVTEGKIAKDSNIRLIRDGIVVYPTKEGQVGEMNALKRFKDDVKEVRAGMECGVSIKNFNDIKVGDVIEAFEITETKQKITI